MATISPGGCPSVKREEPPAVAAAGGSLCEHMSLISLISYTYYIICRIEFQDSSPTFLFHFPQSHRHIRS
nr:MAG TPA: hypothetical protein [Caudoviricetes sp.]